MRRDTHLYWERRPVEILIQSLISEVVGDLMVDRGLSRMQIAELLRMDPPQLSNRLNNRARWTVEDVYQVCRVLGVPLEDVLPPLDEVFGGAV